MLNPKIKLECFSGLIKTIDLNPLTIATIISSFVAFSPYFLNWNFNYYPYDKLNAPINDAMTSFEFRFSLGCTMSVSIPLLLDIFVEFYSAATGSTMSNMSMSTRLIMLSSLLIPDVLIFFLAVPNRDPKLIVLLYCLRNIASVFAIFRHLREYGSEVFKTNGAFIVVILLFCAHIYFEFLSFNSYHVREVYLGFQVYTFLCLFAFGILNVKWMLLLWKSKFKNLTIHQYSVCGYIISISLFGLGILVIMFGFDAQIDGHTTAPVLVGYNYLVAVFAVALSMFQSHITRIEIYSGQQQLLDTKRMFVRLVSHEIRTPLNTAFLGLNLMRDTLQKQSQFYNVGSTMEVLNDVQCSCDVALNILNDLLSYEKMESGLLQLDKRPFPISELIRDAVNPFYIQADQAAIQLRLKLHPESSCYFDRTNILADKNKLCQVTRNFISNALKFTPKNGIVAVTFSVLREESKEENDEEECNGSLSPALKIEVQDTGPGITQENQSKLFKEIIQFSPAELQNGGGSGLGLWIAKSIVDLHHGKIRVHSAGLGTGERGGVRESCLRCTFTAVIPIGSDMTSITYTESISSESIYNNIHPPSQSPIQATTRTISQTTSIDITQNYRGVPLNAMIVDDAFLNRKMLKHVLKNKANLMYEAVDGLDALTYMTKVMDVESGNSSSKDAIHVILMDYMMPNMDGPTAASEIRKLNYMGKIIGITGNALPGDIQYFLDHGADQVLIKPVKASEVESAIFG